jgi:hypothetical protein
MTLLQDRGETLRYASDAAEWGVHEASKGWGLRYLHATPVQTKNE